MKREHGAAQPNAAKSVTAPATVSGERPRHEPLDVPSGKVRGSLDPQVRRPAVTNAYLALALQLDAGGAPGQEHMMAQRFHPQRHGPVTLARLGGGGPDEIPR